MSLGKRWITTLECDGQIVDFKRDMYTNEKAALDAADVDSIGKSNSWKVGAIVVDLDDAERTTPPPSLDEQHQHAERMATKWLARYQDLSAEVGRVPGTCETVDERRQMRAVIEAMRPIVEAALARGLDRKESYQDYSEWVSDVTAAVSANRDRIGAAMSAWENSQTISEDERELHAFADWLEKRNSVIPQTNNQLIIGRYEGERAVVSMIRNGGWKRGTANAGRQR